MLSRFARAWSARRSTRIAQKPRHAASADRGRIEPLERRTLLSFAAFIPAYYAGLPLHDPAVEDAGGPKADATGTQELAAPLAAVAAAPTFPEDITVDL